jgi:site-specific DNA-methyltransferase (adenine-specific)
MLELNRLYLMDCMDGMREFPDKYFELSIVDPPYGNNDAIGIKNGKKHCANRTNYRLFKNDAPDTEYFEQLRRVSKNQIIFGGNFFGLTGGYICWNKHGTAFGEAELVYCSMINSVRIFDYVWNGMIQKNMRDKEIRIHPTQKPVALYKWLLKNYAKPGDKILDTHVGSASSLIACEDMGFEYVGFELDADYHAAATKRLNDFKAQTRLPLEGIC